MTLRSEQRCTWLSTPSLVPCTKGSAQEEGIMQWHFSRMFSQLLTIRGSGRLPRAVFYSPHWTSSQKNPSNHFQTEGLHCLSVMLKKVLHKETQFSLCSPFATSDFKGLCGILLPPFISSPIWSAPSYSAVPQMEVIAELWSPLSPFSDLCKFSYSALSCSRPCGGAGLFCS